MNRVQLTLSILLLALTPACGDDASSTTEGDTTGGPGVGPGVSSVGSNSEGSGTDSTQGESESDPTTAGSSDPSATDPTDPTSATDPTDPTDPTSATDPTDPTGSDGQYCLEECQADADCHLQGQDQGYTCQDGRCLGEPGGCPDDEYCKQLYSGWTQAEPCAAQADCAMTQACIDLGGGQGGCVFKPSDFLTCEDIMQDEVQATAIEGGSITVCKNTKAICAPPPNGEGDPYCQLPCEGDGDCLASSYPVCNVDTGQCECGTDAHCQTQPGASICDAGVCKCGADEDCADLDHADQCQPSGFCGCSSVAVCPDMTAFDGTAYVCEEF